MMFCGKSPFLKIKEMSNIKRERGCIISDATSLEFIGVLYYLAQM